MQTSTTSSTKVNGGRTPAVRRGWARRLVTDMLFVARRDRNWLLLPLILLLLGLAALIVAGTSLGPLAPFIYPLF